MRLIPWRGTQPHNAAPAADQAKLDARLARLTGGPAPTEASALVPPKPKEAAPNVPNPVSIPAKPVAEPVPAKPVAQPVMAKPVVESPLAKPVIQSALGKPVAKPALIAAPTTHAPGGKEIDPVKTSPNLGETSGDDTNRRRRRRLGFIL